MGKRIEAYQSVKLSDEQAAHLIVKLVDAGAFTARDIYAAQQEFRKPQHAEFEGGTLWTLYNAITENLQGGDLAKLPSRTMTMQSIFDPIAAHVPTIEVQAIVMDDEQPVDGGHPEGTDLTDDDLAPIVVVGE
jgi:hypothetical protein